MIPQRDFDSMYDQASTDVDRNIMNREGDSDHPGFVVSQNYGAKTRNRSTNYDSVEFTETSANYMEPLEDEDLLSGRSTPTVVGYYDGMEGYSSKVYDPMNDTVVGRVASPDRIRNEDIGKLPKESYGLPDFFKNPVDLLVASILLTAVIILEIIGLIVLFR